MKGEWALPFRNRSFTWFFIGQLVSAFGDWCSYVVIPILVYGLSGEASSVGILMACRVLPSILLSPFIGRIMAKFSLLRVMIVADIVRGIGYLAFLYVQTPLQIYVLTVVVATGSAFFNHGKFTLIPPLVPQNALARANSYMGGVSQLAMLIGPALGGIVFGALGQRAGLIFNALTYFVSMLSLMLVRMPKQEQSQNVEAKKASTEAISKKESSLARFLKTFQSMRSRRLLFIVVTLGTIPNIGFGGSMTALFPIMASDVFHSPQRMYGAIMSLLGGGIFLGMMIAPYLQKKLPRFPLICWSCMTGAVAVLLFGSFDHPGVALAMIFLVGLSNGVQDNADTTFIQMETTSRGDTADVFALEQALLSCNFIIGTVLAAWLSSWVGPQYAIMTISCVPLTVGLVMQLLYVLHKRAERSLTLSQTQ
ncbi:MAG: MFS transporter [Tumebacillaceae bacterium]